MLEIIFQDDHLVAINKPHGLLVHRSPIAADADEFAVQLLRDQLGQKVFPVHRLDRKTGGVLLFALDNELNKQMQMAFMERRVDKKYLAMVRGFSPESSTIDYPLFDDNGRIHEAITHFNIIEQFEIPVAFGKHQTSRYSLVEVKPETGRMHQIRKHFAHILHPIIGDRPHGCNKQNKLFLETWEMNTMLLHASELKFQHPVTTQDIVIRAEIQSEFCRMLKIMRTNRILDL
jgi:tRNA pseudouridine65 synthase